MDIESIPILIDELMKEDPSTRMRAIRALPMISEALGCERTREELIPYVTQMIEDDDEILLVLIEELYRLLTLRLIGTSRYYFASLLPPFERLCQCEEKLIRDEAVAKLGKLLMEIPLNQFYDYTYPLLQRLCRCEWHTGRISGVTLISYVFPRVALGDVDEMDDILQLSVSLRETILKRRESLNLNQCKEDLRKLIVECCDDSIPTVKRAVLVTLGKMVAVLNDKVEVTKYYLPLFNKLSRDEQDNVKVFAVETLLQFGRVYDCNDAKKELYSRIRDLCSDSGWRVRYIAAEHYMNLCELLDDDMVKGPMLELYVNLLNDSEAEVRAVALNELPRVCAMIGRDLTMEKLIPVVQSKVKDTNKYVRASLASVIIPFCHLLSHKVVTEELLPTILQILKDEFPNVRLHVITNICDKELREKTIEAGRANQERRRARANKDKKITDTTNLTTNGKNKDNHKNNNDIEMKEKNNITNNDDIEMKEKDEEFDINQLQESLIPAIVELTLDKNWRVRLGIVEKFPLLISVFGMKFFKEKIFKLTLGALQDMTAEIRLAAAQQLYHVAVAYDEAEKKLCARNENIEYKKFRWAKDILIPTLQELRRSAIPYLHRIVILRVYQYLCEGLGPNENQELLIEIATIMERDPVPNVRFKACQVLQSLAQQKLIARKHLESLIPQCQFSMKEDKDQDVKYFATKAYESLVQCLKETQDE